MQNAVGIQRYDYTAKLTRSRWAWEFARRNTELIEDASLCDPDGISWKTACHNIPIAKARVAQTRAHRWGLAFFPDPRSNALEANAFWCHHLYPRAINIAVSPRLSAETDKIFDRIAAICDIVHFTDYSGRENLLVKSRSCALQMRCSGHSCLSFEPVKMQIVIDGVDNLSERLRVFEKAKRMFSEYDLPHHPTWSRKSLVLRNALIAIDCDSLGFSHFEIACAIYGRDYAKTQWNSPSDAMRQEIYRSLKRGRSLRDGGYIELLKRR